MHDDSMRTHLITKFKCTKCGSLLNVSYDCPNNQSDYSDGEPSGAYKVDNIIGIHPCEKCMEPVKKVKQAISALIDISAE